MPLFFGVLFLYSCIYYLGSNSNSLLEAAASLFCCPNNTKPLTHKDAVAIDVRIDRKELSIQFELLHDPIASITSFYPINLLASWSGFHMKPNCTIKNSKENSNTKGNTKEDQRLIISYN